MLRQGALSAPRARILQQFAVRPLLRSPAATATVRPRTRWFSSSDSNDAAGKLGSSKTLPSWFVEQSADPAFNPAEPLQGMSVEGSLAMWDDDEMVARRLRGVKGQALWENYDPEAMRAVREKYKHLDFDELRTKLAEADSDLFAPEEDGPWTLRYYKPQDAADTVDDRTAHNERLEDQMFRFVRHSAVHLHTSRTLSWRRGGTISRFFTICVGGNGLGFLGYGFGKHGEVDVAEDLAFNDIRNNIIDVPLFEGRTIANDVQAKHNGTIVKFMRRPRGHGIVAGPAMRYICEAAGLQDISVKIVGNHRPTSVIHATFKALSQVRSARETALDMGKNYYKMYEPGGHMERAPTTFELKQAHDRVQNTIRHAQHSWSKKRWRVDGQWTRYDEDYVPPPPGEAGRAERDKVQQETFEGLSYLPSANFYS
jgi:small subunit ribosomal protein S5